MRVLCQKCGRQIPLRRLENSRRVGREPKYCSLRCQGAAKQARYRNQAPATLQDRIHLRNLVAHGMVAEKLLRDPGVLEIARSNLARWRALSEETPAMREWSELIESGERGAILAALLNVEEEGMRLRSSSPFTGVLDEYERQLIYEATRRNDP